MNEELLKSIQQGLNESPGDVAGIRWVRRLSGGDINHAAQLSDGNTSWFVKYHRNAPEGMFATEACALQEISGLGCIRVPRPVALGECDGTSWLVLEYLELGASGSESLLGEHLAALHQVGFDAYGWSRDNYIGSTPQNNCSSANWPEFWREKRLKPQFKMAAAAGFGGRLQHLGERLMDGLDSFFYDHQPRASLLHGDLWAGNKGFTSAGEPVIFDPASYYGDRETDIAMTELFGGFGADFYAAYRDHYPVADTYIIRRDLYNLYHVLNHLNLFGSSYLSRCEHMMQKLLAEIR